MNNKFEYIYENSDIEKHLIEECEKKSIETGETHFIFDSNLSNFIKGRNLSEDGKRDLIIDSILDDETFHIGNENDFKEMPSRYSYYDTETKLKCRYKRYSFVLDFIQKLGFEPSVLNLGQEMEQSYILELINDDYVERFIFRLKPNLFINIVFIVEGKLKTIYEGFFSKTNIFKSIDNHSSDQLKSIIRDTKIEDILS